MRTIVGIAMITTGHWILWRHILGWDKHEDLPFSMIIFLGLSFSFLGGWILPD